MIQEAYVSFEIAKLLKEKGFDEDCRMYWKVDHAKVSKELSDYNSHLNSRKNSELQLISSNIGKEFISAPTHQMALAWLRGKGFYIQIFVMERGQGVCWSACVHDLKSKGLLLCEERSVMCKRFDSYEEAVEAAILYTLENIL